MVDTTRGGKKKRKEPTLNSRQPVALMFRKVTGPRGFTLCVRDSLHIVVLLFAFEFFSIDFHALSHESLAGKGFVSFSLAFCESNDALMLPHFSLFFIPYLLKEGIPLYW